MNNIDDNAERQQPRIFYGWWIVAAASILGMFGNGSISQGFPRFLLPIESSLGLTRDQMSLVFSLARAEGSVAGPAVGWLVDRYGARPMVFAGSITVGVGVIFLSQVNSYWMLMILFAGVISLGKSAGLGQTLMAGVNQWFIRRRHVAMSALMTAFAGGGALIVPLLNESIQWLGWRQTLIWTGVGILALTLPASFIIRSRPEDMGLRPDGDPPEGNISGRSGRQTRGSGRAEVSFTFREAIRTRTFWMMAVGSFMRVTVTNGMLVHIFAMLNERGLSDDEAAAWVAAMFFLGIPLRFILGVTTGKFRSNLMLAGGMAIGAVGMWGLWLGPGVVGLLAFVIGIAVVEGITSVNWLMLSDYFGRARFATLMGFMSLFMNIGLFASPLFAGIVFRFTESYFLVLATFTPMYLVSGLAFLMCTRPEPPIRGQRRWIGGETVAAQATAGNGDGN